VMIDSYAGFQDFSDEPSVSITTPFLSSILPPAFYDGYFTRGFVNLFYVYLFPTSASLQSIYDAQFVTQKINW
jgi:hypothetical protein